MSSAPLRNECKSFREIVVSVVTLMFINVVLFIILYELFIRLYLHLLIIRQGAVLTTPSRFHIFWYSE
jgi:hypothetical protein